MTDGIGEVFTAAVQAIMRHSVKVEGTVTDIDEQKYTVEVSIGEAIFRNVPMRVLIGVRASVVEIPVLNTDCHLEFLDGDLNRPQLAYVQDVKDLLINCENVIFNEGTLGGMVKAGAATEKLNNIENLLNNFIGLYNAHTHPVISEGAPTGPTESTEGGVLTPTTQADIENPKIKQ